MTFEKVSYSQPPPPSFPLQDSASMSKHQIWHSSCPCSPLIRPLYS
jgi:hypothetical protein